MLLAPGAVQLPLSHLSVRIPWHDTDWTGRVCASPAVNHACTVLANVLESKDADDEESLAGLAWTDIEDRKRLPPCIGERGGFMRPSPFEYYREHAYAKGWKPPRSHRHFASTVTRMPAYSLEAVPYRWMTRDECQRYADAWGIEWDPALEEHADQLMSWDRPTGWLQDHRNQLAFLDTFFSAIEADRSLVFLYVKDLPLLEERLPGTRVLVGAARVREVGPWQEWSYKTSMERPLRSVLWERPVHHSIRPDFADGFLLPYQALLRSPKLHGQDLSRFVAFASGDYFEEFSYVTAHVSHDGAIAALLDLARVVDLLPGLVDGPWNAVAKWISDRMADAWKLRGPYPGLGSALTAAGIERGALVAHRVIASLDDPASNPWPALDTAIERPEQGPAAGLVKRVGKKCWTRLQKDQTRMKLLRLLARFPLTVEQATRLFDREQRAEAGIEVTDDALLDNPYLLYELDRGRFSSISLGTIDRGLFPRDAVVAKSLADDPLPEPIDEAADDRRVRAAAVHVLEQATDEGHTLLDTRTLREHIGKLSLEPRIEPSGPSWENAVDEFDPVLVEAELALDDDEGPRSGWQLARLKAAGDIIRSEVDARLSGDELALEWDWRARIDQILERADDDPAEQQARAEKADALRVLARSRISVLVGPAGTGKTTMLEALCKHEDVQGGGVLLLAPTGKARVQLASRVGAQAQTLAQFLRRSKRWDAELGYRLVPNGRRETGIRTVVVDEASMLTEMMLASLLEALGGVERLIFCGDHRQLPPIGEGRPFADLVRHLQERRVGFAELRVRRRQRSKDGKPRDDLAVAQWFVTDGVHAASDEALARVLVGKSDGTIVFESWKDEDELHQKVVEHVDALGVPVGDADALKRSLGATGTYNGHVAFEFGSGGKGAEAWQMLSPVRNREGGIVMLNDLVRRTWRHGDAMRARRSKNLPPPMGTDEILFHDKVMCIQNHGRTGWRVDERETVKLDVANGEIGMVTHWQGRKGLKVEFSTQPGLQYTFWASDLDGTGERGQELLELAYAVTIHKAQGSQFGVTFVVVPNPCLLLSPELLYTALTRQQHRTVVLVQGDPSELRKYTGPTRSATARRLTNLFRAPAPLTLDGILLDAAHLHRTGNGEMVRSKSEVIVADVFKRLEVRYEYEKELVMADGSWRIPDFTIPLPGGRVVYWEHLGMLHDVTYREDWDRKLAWYAKHGIRPWKEGGGPRGVLVWSTEGQESKGIDSEAIEALARSALGLAG
ncbi:AAA family ATPase [Paraliomyxa miuraensis]|nr:AAA family ATPase [Paraliomyxa miuraensis]